VLLDPWSLLRWTIPALWIAWLLYWWLAARGAKANRRKEGMFSRALHAVPLMLAVWLIAAQRVPVAWLNAPIVPRSIVLFACGVILTAAGLAFTVWARVHLAGNWSGVVTLKQDHTLVRDGPYRHVRHPIYTGLLLALIGSAMARDEWRGVLAVALAFLALWRKLRLEERWLTEIFGDEYRRYRREVRALIPFVF
jgi:protein-S-isoprenylcysteine O-methyltransferase Ste14